MLASRSHLRRADWHVALLMSMLATTVADANATEIVAGEDWTLRWDNSIRISAKLRTEAADPALKNSFRQVPTGAPAPAPASFSFPEALNFNAGDQNFQKKGLVSARADLLSEIDAIWRKDFGVRLSAAAWYDHMLHRRTKADNDPTIGQAPFDEFPARTRRISGGDGEVLDAFVFGGWRFDNDMKLTARLGRHALQYGESLFFGDNGIARAQGPVDIDKLLASPNAQFKEIVRPVPQVSGQLQLSPKMSLGAYYQFRWEADRLPPSGSYFSNSNIPWGSSQSEFATFGPTSYRLAAGGDSRPQNSGQFGLQLKWRLRETDLGFYAARFHSKSGQLYGQLATPPNPARPFAGGSWFFQFPKNVKTVGVSATRSIGEFNVSGEASVRDDMPLRNANMFYGFFPGEPQPRFATGRTAHLNLSTLATFGPSFIARESGLVAEIAWNRVLHKDDPDARLDAGRTRDATAVQLIFSGSYRQVLPGLDIVVPLGLRYTLDGSSAVTAWDSKGNGTANIGVEGNYLGAWQFAFTYTHFIGKAVPFVDFSPVLSGGVPIGGKGNSLADRNYMALSLRRTF
jgi:hypothetical protein